MKNFWNPHYDPSAQNPVPNPELLSDRPIDQLPDFPPNIVAAASGRFKAYANQSGARIYLGTHDSLSDALQAQIDFKLSGTIPHKQRTPHSALPLQRVVEIMLAELGEYLPY